MLFVGLLGVGLLLATLLGSGRLLLGRRPGVPPAPLGDAPSLDGRTPAPAFTPTPVVAPLGPAASPAAGEAENRTVVFTVVGEFAVAFGDILLGRVGEPPPDGRGRYEMPRPQLWGSPEIPYAISPELPDPARVERALSYLREHTPVNFVPYDGHPDAIVFEPGNEHCVSALGRQGGLQPIRLDRGCGTQEVLHEILHALGFVHEQSREDRDAHVEVRWSDIDPRYHGQFELAPGWLLDPMRGTPFDFRSILLYRPEAFALPGRAALVARGGARIDPVTQGLSAGDRLRLERMFGGAE